MSINSTYTQLESESSAEFICSYNEAQKTISENMNEILMVSQSNPTLSSILASANKKLFSEVERQQLVIEESEEDNELARYKESNKHHKDLICLLISQLRDILMVTVPGIQSKRNRKRHTKNCKINKIKLTASQLDIVDKFLSIKEKNFDVLRKLFGYGDLKQKIVQDQQWDDIRKHCRTIFESQEFLQLSITSRLSFQNKLWLIRLLQKIVKFPMTPEKCNGYN